MVTKARETFESPVKTGSLLIYGAIGLVVIGMLFYGIFKTMLFNTFTLPKINKECITDNEKRIIKLEADTGHIKEMMTEQRTDTKELMADVKGILKELK